MCRLLYVLPPRRPTYRQVARCCSSEPLPQKAQQQDSQQQFVRRPTPLYSTPDISQLPERLQRQWDKERNALWRTPVVTPGSRQNAWWRCDCCPAGKEHCWQDRVKETGKHCCPFHSSQRVCKHCNSLEAKYLLVANEWDTASKRSDVTPETVTAHSGEKAHWVCGTCGNSWEAFVHNRTRKGTGCPACSRRRAGGSTYRKHPCLAVFARKHGLFHLIHEWDTEHNL